MPKFRKKKQPPKRVLALPDLEQSKAAVLNSFTSKSGQRTYDLAITAFVDWYCSEPRLRGLRSTAPWFCDTESFSNRSSTLQQLLICAWPPSGAAYEAADSGLLSPELAAGIRRVKGVRRIGIRVGNWLTAERSKRLLDGVDRDSLSGKRNCAILAMLIGCGLRRGGLACPACRCDPIARGALGHRRSSGKGWTSAPFPSQRG